MVLLVGDRDLQPWAAAPPITEPTWPPFTTRVLQPKCKSCFTPFNQPLTVKTATILAIFTFLQHPSSPQEMVGSEQAQPHALSPESIPAPRPRVPTSKLGPLVPAIPSHGTWGWRWVFLHFLQCRRHGTALQFQARHR